MHVTDKLAVIREARRVRIVMGDHGQQQCSQGTVLQRVAGKDASKQFWKYHNESILKKYQGQLQVGSLDSKPKPAQAPTPPATPPPAEKKEVAVPTAESGTLAVQPQAAPEEAEAMDQFVSVLSKEGLIICLLSTACCNLFCTS